MSVSRARRTQFTDDELDCIARGFGFRSAKHMDDVLAGRAPSAMYDTGYTSIGWVTAS